MSAWLLNTLTQFVGPLVVGLLTPVVMDLLKRHAKPLDASAPDAQRMIVAGIAGVGNGLATLLGVTLGADPSAWSDVEVRSVLSAGVAFAVHAGNRAKVARELAAEAAGVQDRARDAATGALAREFEARGEHPMAIPAPVLPSEETPR